MILLINSTSSSVFLKKILLSFIFKFPSKKLLSKTNVRINNLDQKLVNMSGGQRQCIAIARAAGWGEQLIIMDEPTAALGVPEQRKVLELIDTLKKSSIGIIFISHNLNDIFSASDSICVLRQGKKVCEKMISQTNKDEIVSYMVRGEA